MCSLVLIRLEVFFRLSSDFARCETGSQTVGMSSENYGIALTAVEGRVGQDRLHELHRAEILVTLALATVASRSG